MLFAVSCGVNFTEVRVAEGESTQVVISISNPDNETIQNVTVVDPAGNVYIVDGDTLTHNITNAASSVDDGEWQVLIESGSAQPYDVYNSTGVLDVFIARKWYGV